MIFSGQATAVLWLNNPGMRNKSKMLAKLLLNFRHGGLPSLFSCYRHTRLIVAGIS